MSGNEAATEKKSKVFYMWEVQGEENYAHIQVKFHGSGPFLTNYYLILRLRIFLDMTLRMGKRIFDVDPMFFSCFSTLENCWPVKSQVSHHQEENNP